ncbi:MAG: acetyltransferase component of pyruvate dehydrogenase complex [Methyloligella sp.]|nr:MAG: acetyltransferase component of pyruvate dehydrogenase complex [Methyloligella sp.]
MPIPILMPALSPTMEVGTLAKWHVTEGDEVSSGDIIAEIETDKATMEVEAVDEGTIGSITIEEGTANVAVNSTIAVLLLEGEDKTALDSMDAAPAAAAKAPVGEEKPTATPSSEPAAAPKAANATNSNAPQSNTNGRIIASPLAKRIAKQKNIDLTAIKGSGPNGRIIKADLEGAPEGTAVSRSIGEIAQAAPVTGGHAISPVSDKEIFATYEEGTYDLVPLDNMRKVVAERLTVAKSTIPHFYLTIDCELDSLLDARKRLNAQAPTEGPNAFKISVNDFIIKAMGLALQQVPDANSTWSTQGILRHKRSDVSVAVAVEGGLFTPVIRHCELKTLSEISNEMKDLAFRARSKKLAPHEYTGGTTSISNLGMFGIKKFDAVINPPQSTILAVGAGERRPIIVGDKVEPRTVMSVTLSCDHRVVDGALGAELLGAFKGYIEDPVTMLV